MMTFREAERASIKRGVGVRRQYWPEGMFHRFHETGSITAGFVGEDKEGAMSADPKLLDLGLDQGDLAAYVESKSDWEE